MSPPKDKYYIAKAYLSSSNGVNVEFGGVTNFGDQMNKQMMYMSVTGEGGIFKGKFGHPLPCKISDDQMEFYLDQLKKDSNFDKFDTEVREKIIQGTPWSFEGLQEYINKVRSSVRETNRAVSLAPRNIMDKETESDLVKDMQETINKLERELEEKEKVIADVNRGSGDFVKLANTLQNVLQIVQSNQLGIVKNSESIKDVTSHMEHLVNKKGKFAQWLNVFKSPISIQVDAASLILSIIGSEMVIDMMGKAGGPFGEDLSRLRSDGTVKTISLQGCLPREVTLHFMASPPPIAGPEAKSAVIIFLDTIETSLPSSDVAIKFMGETLKTDLSYVCDYAKKHFQEVVFAFPPAATTNIKTTKKILKPIMDIPHLVAVDFTDIELEPGQEEEGVGELEGSEGEAVKVKINAPIKGPGWSMLPAVSRAVAKAVEALDLTIQIDICQLCLGSHFGPCADSTETKSSPVVSSDTSTKEICLRCLRTHTTECRWADRMCWQCKVKGHAASIHEETNKDVQEELRAAFGTAFEFVPPRQTILSKKRILPVTYRDGPGGAESTNSKQKSSDHNQLNKMPRLTMIKKAYY